MPETPQNRRRARLLQLLWDEWDRDREAHRPGQPITTGTVWTSWYRTDDGLGPSRATARDDLAHLARTGHLIARRGVAGRSYRLNTETVQRAGLWLTALPTDDPAFAPLNETAARLDDTDERLLRTAFLRALNTAACGYPLPALAAHANRLHNTARSHEDRTEADGFGLGVFAARIALTNRDAEHAAAA